MYFVYTLGYGDQRKYGENVDLSLMKMGKDFSLGLSIEEKERKRSSSIATCWTEIVIYVIPIQDILKLFFKTNNL